MAKVTGIGGVFFRSRDPKALTEWYSDRLGIVPADDGAVQMWWREDEDPDRRAHTVWSPFSADTEYFGPTSNQFMINYRVDDLDEMLQELESAGVEIDPKREESEFGRFARIVDPEGNRIELWEPPPGMYHHTSGNWRAAVE